MDWSRLVNLFGICKELDGKNKDNWNPLSQLKEFIVRKSAPQTNSASCSSMRGRLQNVCRVERECGVVVWRRSPKLIDVK
jgi:hypothetical protein